MKKISPWQVAPSLILASLSATVSAQDSYQAEFAFVQRNEKAVYNQQKTNAVGAQIYLEDIPVSQLAIAESGFLSKTSNLEIIYLDSDYDSAILGLDASNLVLNGTYIKPESFLIVELNYISGNIDFTKGAFGTGKNNSIELGLGSYLDDHSAIIMRYETSDNDISMNVPNQKITAKEKDIEFGYKNVVTVSNGQAMNLEVVITSSTYTQQNNSQTNLEWYANADYFINPGFSIGATLLSNSGDDATEEGKGYSAIFEYFISPMTSVAGSIGRFYADNNTGDDLDTYALGLFTRF